VQADDAARGARGAPAPGARAPLWQAAAEVAERARASGALQPLGTELEEVPEAGIRFVVRVLEGFQRKVDATRDQRHAGTDPFLPYDPAVFVADASPSHVVLLNKYNVLHRHLLLVTRRYVRQEAALDHDDLHALLWGLAQGEALAFYNGGRAAGASQPHKHLQLVPVPLGRGPEPMPVAPRLEAAGLGGEPGRAPGLPFRHAAARMDPAWWRDPTAGAGPATDFYRALLRAADCDTGGDPRPYSLLATRRFWLLVARRRSACRGIPVNSLAYAGALFARDREQLAWIRTHGPTAVLRAAAHPW